MRERALIVVPTYNERDTVREVAREFLRPLPDGNILFVDDNSPDGTGAICDELAASDARIHVLHRPGKAGLGAAYIAGFRWGMERGYDYVFEMDADFSHNPVYLPEMLAMARAGTDMVVGSRYVAGGGTSNWGWGRKALSRAGSLYSRSILGVQIRDLTSGFSCIRRQTLEALDLDSIDSSGYSFQIELKYMVLQAGLTIREFPIVFEERRVGQSKMSPNIAAEALWRVWQLKWAGRKSWRARSG